MKEIKFDNFNIKQGYFSCIFTDQITSAKIEFKLNVDFPINNNLIALALSTLCGRGNYSQIYFDLDISKKTLIDINKFCHSNIISSANDYPALNISKVRDNIALNFSGGFDSLAAKGIMPLNTKLVSMDFGGKFSREEVFFKKFHPYIVQTNILSTHLTKNSWSFMGIASILFSEYLNLKYFTFGGILEAGPNNILPNPGAAKMETFNPFYDSGLLTAPYVLGITEIGTALIISQTAPEHIYESLKSLANNGEQKKFRKQLITDIIYKKYNLGYNVKEFDQPNNKWEFGKSFTSDFLSFYFIKNVDEELIYRMYNNIPNDVLTLSKELSLNFYERINTNFLEKFPKDLLPDFSNKLYQLGILPYTEKDWTELHSVIALLKKYHNF